jgi:cardiolipin synthase
LINGREFLPAMLGAIDGAQHSVHFMVYVWEPGSMSDAVLAALERAAARGVAVRVLLDGHGARSLPASATEALERSGGQVATFRPLRLGWLMQAHKRNHRRAIVIDGKIGFTGGAGVKDTWLGDGEDPDQWRDDMVQVTGELARSVQGAFTELWAQITGEVPAGTGVYPERPSSGGAGEPITHHVSLASSPASEHTPMRTLFWLSFASARTRIWITNPYVIPDSGLRAVLCERARAGVDVRIMTAGGRSDWKLVNWAARNHYEEFLDAGVRIYEYEPTLIHSKLALVDDAWSIVGSANLDFRSTELNEENVLAIQDARFARQLERVFLNDLVRANEVQSEAWHERQPVRQVRLLLFSLFQRQL